MFFNPNDYKYTDQNDDDDDSQYINRNGDQMVGELTVPYIKLISTINPITFGDETIQATAFNIDNDIIKDINIDISNIRLDISKFNLDISDINVDISNISYDKILILFPLISNNKYNKKIKLKILCHTLVKFKLL